MQELMLISKYKNSSRDVILRYLAHKKCIWNALREIAFNVKRLKLTTAQKRKLNKHAKTIKALTKGTKDKRRRSKIVQQTGGILNILLPAVAALLPTIVDLIK